MSPIPHFIGGLLLTVDDFIVGFEAFGTRIQPLMKSHDHLQVRPGQPGTKP